LAEWFSVEAQGIIAVATTDCLEMVIAALASWRLGCAYLPIDPTGPPLRLEEMLSESNPIVLAATNSSATRLPSGPWRKVVIPPSISDANGPPPSAAAEPVHLGPSDLAYVIYTSGSTGKSKGVGITHGNLRHLVSWHTQTFQVGPEDRGTQFAALTFDAAVLETWPILGAGASLHVPESGIPLQPERLRDYLIKEQISICFAVTPVAEQLLSIPWPRETTLRYLLTGADVLRSFPRANIPFHLVNNYGPTECTVLATSGIVPVQNGTTTLPTLGKVVPGTEIHILDSEMAPVRKGEIGQICIGGTGVGAGYVRRPDLTAERFKMIPALSNSRIYLTGDLGRELPSGEIESRGRLDDEIKIRGYRISPHEIVTALHSHSAIESAAVITVGEESGKRLVTYIVARAPVTSVELREHLRSRIPPYMIPNCFVRLAELPLTSSGKIDRAALPAPDDNHSIEETVPELGNRTETQTKVAAILSGLLDGRRLKPGENFFHAGGHSLLAAQIIVRIRSAFQVDLPLRTIFESPTVGSLSREIETRLGIERPIA
jgi:amino acid adenylation domain-containing protein